MEGTRPKPCRIGGHPAPTGPALTNDLCGQNVKVKVKVNVFISALAKTSAVLTLTF